jgi:hypothetical protein
MPAPYPKVSAAEKYAEGPRKRCKCHGEEMQWASQDDFPAGGRWRCPIRARARAVRHKERHPDRVRDSKAKYRESPKGRATTARHRAEYYARPEVKAAKAKYHAERNARPEVRAARAERNATPEAKAAQARRNATPKARAARARYSASEKGHAAQHRYHLSAKGFAQALRAYHKRRLARIRARQEELGHGQED